ncbi:kinase-like domain-containing protein, partial [Hyaloraphidium curvatum]
MQGDILAMPAPGGGVPAAGAPSYSRPLSRNHRHSRSSISLSSLGSLGSSLLDSALDMLNPQSRATPPPPAARESPRPGSPASLAPSLAASSLAPDADADGDFFVSSAFRRGSFGTMRHAVFRPTGEKLVCKCISDGRKASPAPSLPDVMSSSCESETIVADDDAPRLSGEQGTEDPGGQLAVVQEALLCSILEGMDNIVRLRGFQELPSERQYRLFFDFVDGCDLSALAGSGRRLNESDMRPLAFGVFRAVQTCHRLGISHRDLKLENI